MKEKITIVGAGPAGLFAAHQLLKNGFAVDLYDQMSGVGKKFLVAGNGGLNLTHSEDLKIFVTRYGKDQKFFKSLLSDFLPSDLRTWCEELGVKTFVGSSGRVFPEKLKAAEILMNWVKELKSFNDFNLYLKHRLTNITKDKILCFESEEKKFEVQADKLILSFGGASWEKTGSDGKWKSLLENLGIEVKPFLPMNCGFERPWSDYFIRKIDRAPLKNICIKINEHEVRGEAMLTPFGIEGGGIYAVSNFIRDEIIENKKADVVIDLKPDLSFKEVMTKLGDRKKDSLSNFLRKSLSIDRVQFTLLCELCDKEKFSDDKYLANSIKELPLRLFSARPLTEAISTSGGVAFSQLTENLEVRAIPGLYIAGEMLDFEAPTGGYLLQGCFSTAWRVVKVISRL